MRKHVWAMVSLLVLAAPLVGHPRRGAALDAVGCCTCTCVNGILCDDPVATQSACDAQCAGLLYPCSEPLVASFNPGACDDLQLQPCAAVDRAAPAPTMGGVGLVGASMGLVLIAWRRFGRRR